MNKKDFFVSIIISVYKDLEALNLILGSLSKQTYQNFEVIISEDCDTEEMKEFINNYKGLNLVHTYQKDIGWRKNIALNNAIRKSTGDYLIFLDGDIIPYSNFVEMHITQAKDGYFLSGRRVELGQFFSSLIRKKYLSYRVIEQFYILFTPLLIIDRARHIEEGIFLKPLSYLERKINGKKSRKIVIVGCNFSCFKKDLEAINGFDEDYISPSVGEDGDIFWRLQYIGLKPKSVRHIANTFHLYHPRSWSGVRDENYNKMQSNIKKEQYFCLNGLTKIKK